MDFRQFDYMLKVAEEKSISKAAKELYISQPSLSQYILKLEQQLGVQLFDRTTNPLRLTLAGELYAETAVRILDLQNELTRKLDDIANLQKGSVTIGLSPFRSTYILPSVLPLFKQAYPGIEVKLAEGTMSELEDLTLKGITDFSFMTLPVQEELLSYDPILTEEILVAVPPNHSLRTKLNDLPQPSDTFPTVQLEELSDEPFIILKQGHRLRQVAIDLCHRAGFKPRIILETRSAEAAHSLVTAGTGVTFIPDTLVWFGNTAQHPLYFSLEKPVPTRTLVAAYRDGRYLSAASRMFIAMTKEILGSVKSQKAEKS